MPRYVYDITGILPYVGTVPDMPNIYNTLTNIGHRFGHQICLDESSGRNSSTTFLYEIVFRIYLVFSITGKHTKH